MRLALETQYRQHPGPQSRTSDFYRELADLFAIPLAAHNRWAAFKIPRARWSDHITQTLIQSVLVVDEAQENLTTVFNELSVLASKDLDSRQLLCVVLASDQRPPERLRAPDLQPLGRRIRRRLVLDYASRDESCACLDHLLDARRQSRPHDHRAQGPLAAPPVTTASSSISATSSLPSLPTASCHASTKQSSSKPSSSQPPPAADSHTAAISPLLQSHTRFRDTS